MLDSRSNFVLFRIFGLIGLVGGYLVEVDLILVFLAFIFLFLFHIFMNNKDIVFFMQRFHCINEQFFVATL